MITISLRDFALTGRFGQVGLGMTQGEVIAHLGKPDGIVDLHDNNDVHYGWYEFFCDAASGKLFGIQNDHLRLSKLGGRRRETNWHRMDLCFENDTMEIDPWFLKPGKDTSYFQVIDLLRAEGISFEEQFVEISGWRIVFPSKVFIDFDYAWDSPLDDDPPNDKAYLVVNGIRLWDLSI